MSFEYWTAFVIASTALLAIPGPTVTVVVGHAISNGKRAARATIFGVVLGDFVAMTASLLGIGAVLAASATLFTLMKVVGAVYLIWLGIKMWRTQSERALNDCPSQPANLRHVFWNCFVVTALNPKDILFFVAFVPQFLDPSRPPLQQLIVLELTFLIMVALNIAVWSLAAGHMQTAMRGVGRIRLFNRIGGTLLISAGLLTARA